MKEKYLATNLEPLKAIGEGKVIDFIINFIERTKGDREQAKLVAYQINSSHPEILIEIQCLFETGNGLSFREFEFYSKYQKIGDHLKTTAEYGLGIHCSSMEWFFQIRKFYEERLNIKAE